MLRVRIPRQLHRVLRATARCYALARQRSRRSGPNSSTFYGGTHWNLLGFCRLCALLNHNGCSIRPLCNFLENILWSQYGGYAPFGVGPVIVLTIGDDSCQAIRSNQRHSSYHGNAVPTEPLLLLLLHGSKMVSVQRPLRLKFLGSSTQGCAIPKNGAESLIPL